VQTQSVEYRDAAGKRYVGYLACPDRPDRASGPAVLIAHNAPGVADFERDVAHKLAARGYVAFCADYVGDGEVLSMEGVGERLGAAFADSTLVRPAILAGLATLEAQPGVDTQRIAAMGYCFGGTAVLELARTGANLKAVAGIHSGLPVTRPEDHRRIRGQVLLLQGAADPYAPPELRTQFETQMNAAGVDWRMILYGCTEHAFAVPDAGRRWTMPGIAYQPAAAARSWRAVLELLEETIGLP
jgi:dienelactone hydrolase